MDHRPPPPPAHITASLLFVSSGRARPWHRKPARAVLAPSVGGRGVHCDRGLSVRWRRGGIWLQRWFCTRAVMSQNVSLDMVPLPALSLPPSRPVCSLPPVREHVPSCSLHSAPRVPPPCLCSPGFGACPGWAARPCVCARFTSCVPGQGAFSQSFLARLQRKIGFSERLGRV